MSVWRETPASFQRFGNIECVQRVTSVSLNGAKATDAVVPHLIKFRRLRSVDFGPDAAISAEGIRKFTAALPNCEITNFNSSTTWRLTTLGKPTR